MQKSLLRTYVTADLEQTIKDRAKAQGLSVSATVEQLIRNSLETESSQPSLDASFETLQRKMNKLKVSHEQTHVQLLFILAQIVHTQEFNGQLWATTPEGVKAIQDHRSECKAKAKKAAMKHTRHHSLVNPYGSAKKAQTPLAESTLA